MTPTILIFLKAPRLGTVKTRLAAEIGEVAALAAYRALVARQCACFPANWPVEIHFTPSEAEPEMRAWLGAGARVRYFAQPTGGLGERLAAATAGALARGATGVCLIGGDAMDLDETRLREAALLLARHDAVLGPARDGGYVLFGIKCMNTSLFTRVPWSTAAVAATTRARLRALGWTWVELPESEDVDDRASWERWRVRDERRALLGREQHDAKTDVQSPFGPGRVDDGETT